MLTANRKKSKKKLLNIVYPFLHLPLDAHTVNNRGSAQSLGTLESCQQTTLLSSPMRVSNKVTQRELCSQLSPTEEHEYEKIHSQCYLQSQ